MFPATKLLRVLRGICIFFFVLIQITSVNALKITEITVVRGEVGYPNLNDFHVELVTQVCDSMGITANFVDKNWTDALSSISSRNVTALLNVIRTKEREKFIIFDENNILSTSQIALYSRKESKQKLSKYANIDNIANYPKKIGVVADYDYASLSNFPSKLKIMTSNKQLVKQLVDRKIDLIALYVEEFERLSPSNSQVTSITKLGKKALAVVDNYIGFSMHPEYLDLAKKFGKSMVKYKETEEYKQLLAKYDINKVQ